MATASLARMVSKQMLNPEIVQADFAMVEPPQVVYRAGQYIILHTAEEDGKVVKRSYSISSPPPAGSAPPASQVPASPTPAGGFSLCVKIVGVASKYIADLDPGDLVKFSGPWGMGKFTFPENPENEIVMIATGTGLSPIFSLLSSHLAAHPDKRFSFLWGLKKETDIFYMEELDRLRQNHPNFSYQIILSEPGPSWPGKRGLLSGVFAGEIGTPAGKEYFLAGNGNMVNRVESALKAAGVSPDRIHKEIFFLPCDS